MLTHERILQYITAEGRLVNATDSVQGDGEVSYDGTIATSGTPNVEVDVAFAFAKVKSMLLYSTTGMTIKTNSTGAPDDTLTLAAGQALVWNTNDPSVCPFTADVTKLYFTNASASVVASVKVRVLLDVTP